MATIKTQGGAVITKGGLVSCSCCETGCCMYSAQGLADGLFSEDDLPDSLILNPYDLNFDQSVEVQRNGLIYGPYPFFETYGQQVAFREDLFGQGPAWVLETDPSFVDAVLDYGPCLFEDFGDGFATGPGFITDTFKDTYLVTTYETFQINRISLCEWVGYDSNGCEAYLIYEGSSFAQDIPNLQFPFKWSLFWAGLFDEGQEGCGAQPNGAPKTGTQNTPVGTYVATGFSDGGSVTATIAEP